jgi:uncharacterized protein YecE (DUF72 family)
MRVAAGTSGFAYKEWRGSFYPEGMKEEAMLSWYAGRFATVEINNTFYRLPNEKTLRHWMEQVPPGFTFSIKASRSITHMKRLKDAADPTAYLFRVTATLGERRGPILFGLPPNLKVDLDRLRAFLDLVPADVRVAIDFRHESWFDDAVLDELRGRGVALCIEHGGELDVPFVSTAPWGYLRLRAPAYGDDELDGWAERVLAQPWSDAFVYFKHEDAGVGPALAAKFMERIDGGPQKS